MKKEDLIKAAELYALLAENGEGTLDFDADEPIGTQHVIALQKAVLLLSRQVADLQSQLHEHLELHNKQQEQLLRQMNHQMEHKLYEQIIHRVVGRQDASVEEGRTELQGIEATPSTSLALISEEPSPVEQQPTYSRVKSYRKIRKRKKGFLERLFE
ncbi:hypothetical protein P5G65_28315 [Paenibacillus chondroitinus]|uniref:Uncharacterized protein n=1 Tax=Paenibacillus chondroitinus TaxID=59842 RepID=A0ABU6DKJ3_9BACL|nr:MULTISPECIES: hypothetical protein [Paenibacillus]MCY9657538.1 hypothetical protein [Paenibacillus anseongense]MEB4797812.1 hypothetical protein [Paenibacillus chondroitinus]